MALSVVVIHVKRFDVPVFRIWKERVIPSYIVDVLGEFRRIQSGGRARYLYFLPPLVLLLVHGCSQVFFLHYPVEFVHYRALDGRWHVGYQVSHFRGYQSETGPVISVLVVAPPSRDTLEFNSVPSVLQCGKQVFRESFYRLPVFFKIVTHAI